MARIRTYKPELFTDRKTGRLPPLSLKLFLGLITHADDYGVLAFEPVELSARILPFDKDLEALERVIWGELLPLGLVLVFLFDGVAYIWIPKFGDHQRINRKSDPLLPDWDKLTSKTPKAYLKAHGVLNEHSFPTHGPLTEPAVTHCLLTEHSLGNGMEGNGVERNGSGVERNGLDGKPDVVRSAQAPLPPPARPAPEPGDEEPVLGRDFSVNDVATELGLVPPIEPKKSPLSDPAEVARRKAAAKAQLADMIAREQASKPPAPTKPEPQPEPEDEPQNHPPTYHDDEDPEPDWDSVAASMRADNDENLP